MGDSVTGMITAAGSLGGAIVTAYIAWSAIPSIKSKLDVVKRKLYAAEYILNELDDLIRIGANGPEDPVHTENQLSIPVQISRVEVGRHDPVFDRIVFEFKGAVPGYSVTPLKADDLSRRDVQGVWGLSIKLVPCRIRYLDGPQAGDLSIENTKGYPRMPAITEFRLVYEDDAVCEWVVGVSYETRYLVVPLNGPPRLAVDVFCQKAP